MASLKVLVAAGRLRILVGGEIDLADPNTIARAQGLLAEFTPAERGEIASKAVELGADAVTVQALLGLVSGEVIEVSSRAPRRWPWWAWLAGGTAVAAAVGGAFGVRARRQRGGLGISRPQKDALARVVAEYKDVVRSQGGYADPNEFRRRVTAAGVPLETLRFYLDQPADLQRLKDLYNLDAKAFKRLQQELKAAPASARRYEVAITDDGMAIDWIAGRIKPGAPAPFVFWVDGFEAQQQQQQQAPVLPAAAAVRHVPGGAAAVRQAALSVGPDGRFHHDKVFISEAHKELVRSGVNISLPDFKRQLLRMLRDGSVILTRADLVGAMDRNKVAASEIEDMGSTFHFIYLPER